MEMKRGYKQTDVGFIPEDWRIRNLSFICDVRDGTHESPRFFSQGVPFVTSKNIVDGHLDLENVSYISKSDAVEFDKRSKVDRNDILLSMIGTIGSAVLVDCEPNFCIKNVALLKVQKASPTFLLHLINSPIFQRYLADNLDGGIQKFVSLGTLRQLSVPLPDDFEQCAIAEALSDVDALLGALDRLIAKKRDVKQAAMQQLLTGNKRLPGFTGEWETDQLRSFVRRHNSGVYKKSELYGKGSNIVGVADLYGIDCVHGQGFAEVPLSTAERAKHSLETNDLLYGESSLVREGIARTVYVTERGACTAFAWHTRRYSVDQNYLISPYLYYYLQGRRARKHMMDQSIQTAITGINTVAYFECPVLIPSVPEQRAIAEVLSDMGLELAALARRRDKTRNLKQAMMHELLTGRTRFVSPVKSVVPLPQAEDAATPRPAHNWQINEAVIIGALTLQFGTEEWPLPRKRRVKLTYLLHRHAEGKAQGFLKKAAGPYNPKTKYQGPEAIALKNGYVREHNNGTYVGFVAAEKIAQAEQYFAEWYPGAKEWLEQFRFEKTDELELLTTVDMAMEDLCKRSRAVNLKAVKEVISTHPEWEAKLSRPVFCDTNIKRAIGVCSNLFAS